MLRVIPMQIVVYVVESGDGPVCVCVCVCVCEVLLLRWAELTTEAQLSALRELPEAKGRLCSRM